MKIIVFDTETTGKANFNLPPEHDKQPRIVQIGAVLTDGERDFATIDLMIRPNGFEIPEEASNIHGITTDMAIRNGVSLKIALTLFCGLCGYSDVMVAHNSDFDLFVLKGECKRAGVNFPERDCFCTMKAMTDMCKIPGPYGFKCPRLQQAYVHCFGKEFEGAHNALSDVMAAKGVYFWIQNQPPQTAPELLADTSST